VVEQSRAEHAACHGAYGDDRTDGGHDARHEGVDLADGAVPAEGGDQVVVDPDLSDEEEGRRRDLPLLCRATGRSQHKTFILAQLIY